MRHAALLTFWGLLLVAGVAADARASTSGRLLHRGDPAWDLLDELVRAGDLDPEWTRGDRTQGELCEAVASLAHPAATTLRGWLACRGDRSLGLRAGVDLVADARHTDPVTRLTPTFLDLTDDADPQLRLQTRVHADARLATSLVARFLFRFDSEGKNDPHNRTRDFNQLGVSNNVDEAYLRWSNGRGAILLGRAPLAWGPERAGSLLLGDLAPALDQVRAELRWSRHLLRAVVAQLSSTSDDQDRSVRRYLYAHRVDLHFRTLRIGISETAVVAGPNESLSLRYLNPIQFYAQAQVEQDGDSGTQVNVFNAVDAEVTWRALHPYGSLLVDDLQIDAAGRDRYPHQLAAVGGVDVDWRRVLAGYEYRRIGTWTYLHRGEGTTWHHFERPLGAPEGPDTDAHLVRVLVRPRPRLATHLSIERWRRGENRLWTEEDRAGHAGEPFPRGQVERRWVGRVGLAGDLPPWARLRGEVAWHRIRNVNNGPDHETVFEARLMLELKSPVANWRTGD